MFLTIDLFSNKASRSAIQYYLTKPRVLVEGGGGVSLPNFVYDNKEK